MSKLAKALTAAAGNAGGEPVYVEDVFSTYLYTGNGSTQTITNGIDLDGEGGLVWEKNRTGTSYWHHFRDSETGESKMMELPNTSGLQNVGAGSFTATGYTANATYGATVSGRDYVSWTFRKAEKFFDIVTWTGDETTNRMINHNLGSTPGLIIVKATNYDGGNPWSVYHRSLGATKGLRLNTTSAAGTDIGYWYNQSPTDTQFGVGTDSLTNGIGKTYVAYLFAHDAGGFGDDGSESIIKCGSFTGNTTVDLGFEPAWIMIKPTSTSGNWDMHDVMRGWPSSGDAQRLKANSSEAETSTSQIYPNATGFSTLIGSASYIYIAIRRPMKTPEAGTDVFAAETIGATNGGSLPSYVSGFPVDMLIQARRDADNHMLLTRLLGKTRLFTNLTIAESAESDADFDYQDGAFSNTSVDTNRLGYMFKRATGFFDVVAYAGTGSAHNEAHNLGVAPELMIIKPRDLSYQWSVWHKDIASTSPYYEIVLNSSDAQTDVNTTNAPFAGVPTSTEIPLPSGTASASNRSGYNYIAYLFATLAGVSKVGSYTGTGSNVDVDCGFSAGARFILIKRTDSSGDWYVYDSERGIVAGNDPYLLLNSTAAEVTSTDYIDPLSSGFTVTSSAPAALNTSGGEYIFLAIA